MSNKPNSQTPGMEDLIQVRIARLIEIISQLAKSSTQAHGLSNTDLRILNIVDRTDGVGVNEIARRAHIDKAWVSRSLRTLKNKGMVTQKSLPRDSRLKIVELTTKSKNLLDGVRPIVTEREKRLLEGINSKSLKSQLDQLMINAETLLNEIKND